MKVICIDAEPNFYSIIPYLLKHNQIYTVVGEEGDCYHLLETDAVDKQYCYKKSRFIPLSEIDETEMIREYNKDLIQK